MGEHINLVTILLIVAFVISFLYIAMTYKEVIKVMKPLNKNFGGYYFNMLPANADFFRAILILRKHNSKLTSSDKKTLIYFIVSTSIGTLCVILLIIMGFVCN